ncbi:MAG: hypothetical protein GXO37_05335 [Chloroflexi bacterium]|nr:hypothetical protein [Chloroflexota bacterium]
MKRAWLHLTLVAAALTALGLSTLAYVVLYHEPGLLARLVFFWAVIVTGAGLSLLPLALVHRRFRGRLPRAATLWREGLLVGAFLGLWAWLQLDRLASPWVLMALGLALALLELVWLLWTESTDAS